MSPSFTFLRDRNVGVRSTILLGVALWAAAWILGVFEILEWALWPMLPLFVLLAFVVATRPTRILWWTLLAAALAIVIIAFTPITRPLVRPLVRRDPLPARVNAVVVLSGGSTDDQLLNTTGLDRLLSGVELLHRGLADTIIVTEPRSLPSSEPDQRATISLVPATVFVARDVRTTHDEALVSAAIARQHGIHTIALVTSPTHTRRACATFEKVGFQVACVPSADRLIAVGVLDSPIDRIRAWQEWLYETLGTIKYRAEGWM